MMRLPAAGRQADPQSKRSLKVREGDVRGELGEASATKIRGPLRRRVWYDAFEGSSSPFVRGFDHPLTDEQRWEES